MKIKAPQLSNVIDTPEEFAVLNDVDNRYYRYVVSYTLNVVQALKAKGHVVKISITRNPPNAVPKPVLTNANSPTGLAGVDTGGVTRALLTRASVVKDVIRSNQANHILTITSDFTAWIPNDKASQLSAAVKNSGVVEMRKTREFNTVSLQTLTDANVRVSVLETPLNQSNPTQLGSNELRRISSELIHNRGIDPAQLIVRQDNIAHAEIVHGGISQQPNKTRTEINQPQLGGLLVESLSPKSAKPSTSNLQPLSYVSQPALLSQTEVRVFERLDVPVELLGNAEYYLVYELVTMEGAVIQTITRMVDHGKNVASLLTPRTPPSLNCIPVSKLGTNILEVFQTDPKAIGVSLYRKVMSKTSAATSAEYSFIGKVPLSIEEGRKKIEDVVPNFNNIIYRVVPYGKNNLLGAEFASLVVVGQKAPALMRVKSHQRPRFVSMSYEINERGIQVEMRDIPPGVVALELLKKDLTSHRREKYVDSPVAIRNTGNGTYYITDNDIAVNHIYKYFCKLVYKDGAVEFASNELIVEYTPKKTNIIETKATTPQVVQSGTQTDVRFILTTTFVAQSEDTLKLALEKQNLISYFSGNITVENLQSLVAYRIIRTNLTTGEVEEYGITVNQQFSDVELGSVCGVKPPQNGHEYSYDVTTFLRTPTSALEGYTQSVADSNYSSKDYTYQPWSWRHPVTLTEGNTITKSSLQRNHSKTQFTFGEVGKITRVFMSLVGTAPTVFDAKATKVNSKLIRVQWKVQGTVTKIDHFIVILEVLGMKTVVGKCHNITETNYFEFFDELNNGEKGDMSYIIVPVHFDYSRGKETQTNKVLI